MRKITGKRALSLLLTAVMVFSLVLTITPAVSAAEYNFGNVADGTTDKALMNSLFSTSTDEGRNFLLTWFQVGFYAGFDTAQYGGPMPPQNWSQLTSLQGSYTPNVVYDEANNNYVFSTKESNGGDNITITFVDPHFVLDAPSYNNANITQVGTIDSTSLTPKKFTNNSATTSSASTEYSYEYRTEISQSSRFSATHTVGTTVTVGAQIKVVNFSVAVNYSYTNTAETSKTIGTTEAFIDKTTSTVNLPPYTYAFLNTSKDTGTFKMPYTGTARLVYDVKIEGDNDNATEEAVNFTYNNTNGIKPASGKSSDMILYFGYSASETAMSDVRGALNAYNPGSSSMGGSYNGFTWADYSPTNSAEKLQAEWLSNRLSYLYERYNNVTASYSGDYTFTTTILSQSISPVKSMLAIGDMKISSGEIVLTEGDTLPLSNISVSTKDSAGNSPYYGFDNLEKKWFITQSPTQSSYNNARTFYDSLPLSDTYAAVKTNISTGSQYLEALRPGTTYLNLAAIYENPASNDIWTTLTTGDTQGYVKVTVKEKPKVVYDLFDDISGSWAKDYINSLGIQEYVKGKGNRIFAPNETLTRAQFVQIIYNAFGGGDTSSPSNPFDDTNPNMWYNYPLNWAYANGLITGYSATKFGPNDNITREQMAVLIIRAADKFSITFPNVNNDTVFTDDAKISEYAKNAVYAMRRAGIIEGKPGNLFDPKGSTTRAEMSKVMYFVLDYAGMIADQYKIG